MSIADKRRTFRALHQSGCFVIPNPWDRGTAIALQGLGFKALATTSSGFAHSQGYADEAQLRDQVLVHFVEIAAAADVPVNADFEHGFADDLGRLAENVTRCIATGVAGLSIEDSTGDPARPLYDFDFALARVKAPTLLIVGGDDAPVVEMNREAMSQMTAHVELEIVRGATHLFEEPGTLEQVCSLATDWFDRYLRIS